MHILDPDTYETLGLRASGAVVLAAISGSFLDHWITRSVTSALIGVCFLLLGELLKPWVQSRGRKLVEGSKKDPPTP